MTVVRYEMGTPLLWRTLMDQLSEVGPLARFFPKRTQKFGIFPQDEPPYEYNLRVMDESKFSSSCRGNSFYISLHDQNLENPSRQIVSSIHTTHVHFAIRYEQHWAAVQLSISPFSLVQFPGQIFYSSSFRYSLCCQPPPATDIINSVVQRIYNTYFYLSPWDFSPKYCSTYEPHGLDCGPADISCAKKTEITLFEYICGADTDIPAPVRQSNELSSRNKRRRLDSSYKRTGSDDGKDHVERSVTDIADPVEGIVTDIADLAEESVTDDENKQDNAVKILTKKIRSGINEKAKQIRARKRQAASTGIALLNTTSHQPENPQTKHATFVELITTQSTQQMSLEHLIKMIWDEANELLRVSADISWKYLFLCSCLRILHGFKDDNKTVARWVHAARIINSIVNGLWEHWGPHALFVYEALAAKNYLLGVLSRGSEVTGRDVAIAVVDNLSQEQLPSELQGTNAFHPSAFISALLNTEYSIVCHKLQLARLGQLGPIKLLHMHVSTSPLQREWEVAHASRLETDAPGATQSNAPPAQIKCTRGVSLPDQLHASAANSRRKGSADDQEHRSLVDLGSCDVSPNDASQLNGSNKTTVFVGDCPDREQLTQATNVEGQGAVFMGGDGTDKDQLLSNDLLPKSPFNLSLEMDDYDALDLPPLFNIGTEEILDLYN